MRHFPLRECGYAIGFVVILAAIYVGRGEGVFKLFDPMHALDLKLRPGFWLDPPKD